jgi:DNA-binding CsgD family transcriptional regulator
MGAKKNPGLLERRSRRRRFLLNLKNAALILDRSGQFTVAEIGQVLNVTPWTVATYLGHVAAKPTDTPAAASSSAGSEPSDD